MAGIIDQIDLRSKEFIISRRPIRPATIKLISGIILIYFTAALLLLSNVYADLLQSNLKAGKAELLISNIKADNLTSLSDETLRLKGKQDLLAGMLSDNLAVSEILNTAHLAALQNELDLDQVIIDQNGILTITGKSGSRLSIAEFSQLLNDQFASIAVTVNSIEMTGRDTFSFTINRSHVNNAGEKNTIE